jgi:prevent-host-death family protein
MRVPLSEAKARLTDLVRRAEAGELVMLTRHGKDVARIAPVVSAAMQAERLAIIDRVVAMAKPTPGPDAAHSADFLYDEDGLPG